MVKIFLRVLAVVLAIVIVAFSVNNREIATVDLWPLQPVSLPVWGIAWIGVVLGLVLGFVISWFSAGTLRARNRNLMRRIESDQRDMAALRKRAEKSEAAAGTAAVSLPPPEKA